MQFKRIVSVLLATTVIVSMSLSGCGNTSDNKTETENEATDTEGTEDTAEAADKIIIFQSKVDIADPLEELAEEYQEETGVEVEVWGATGDDYYTQIKTKLANNQGPTIFSLAPGSESQQLSAYLDDLSGLSFVDKILDGMPDEIDGKVVGIPFTMEGFGLVYNKSAIDTSTISDTDSFIEMMKTASDEGSVGFGLSQESYFIIGHILNTPFALQEDPEGFMDKVVAGEQTLTDVPEFQELAKVFTAIKDYSYNPLEVDYDKACGDFATGKTWSIHQGNWAASMFADYDMDFEMGLTALPLAGNDKLAVSVPSAWYVNSQATDAERQAGKDFLEWLYASETGEKYLMEEFGFIPVVEGMTNENLDVLSQDVQKYAEEGNTLVWATNHYPAGIVDVYLVPVMEEFFTTDMSEEALLEGLQNAFVEAGK